MGLFGTIGKIVTAPVKGAAAVVDLGGDLIDVIDELRNVVTDALGPFATWTGVDFVLDLSFSTVRLAVNIGEATLRDLENVGRIKGFDDLLEFLNPIDRAAAIALSALLDSAEEALLPQSAPLPDELRDELAAFNYPTLNPETLSRARFLVGDGDFTLPDVINRVNGFLNGGNHAVVAGRVILFRKPPTSIGFWAHEVTHVDQYRRWGIHGFADRYLFRWARVEGEAKAVGWAATNNVSVQVAEQWLEAGTSLSWQLAPTPFLGTRPFMPPEVDVLI